MKRDTEERQALRKRYILARESLTEAERTEKSRRAVERIASLPAFREARTVMIYRAVRGELSLEALAEHPAAAGKRFAYPLCINRTEMAAMVPGGWRPGPFGIPEPEQAVSEEIPPEAIDLVICPGTAFDSRCSRLGMGGGYYDRFLPKCMHASVVMAAFEVQHAENLPRGRQDVPMDCVVTEAAVYTGSRRKKKR